MGYWAALSVCSDVFTFSREESQPLTQSSYIKYCKQEAITPNPASDWGCAFGLLNEGKKEM